MKKTPIDSSHKPEWTFLTNHAHVLVCIHRDPTIRTRDIAQAVDITERATQRIVADLVAEGYLTREREGRRNVYTVTTTAHFRHPIEAQHCVGDLLGMLDRPTSAPSSRRRGLIH
ncbi:MAG: MarR family transcriptional regulator [Acidobacteria bacterium]|nr:MarR family transcriptional regulator [Acidobacteriota bacterium]